MKRLITTMILSLILSIGLGLSTAVYAANEELTETTFSVKDILRLPGEGDQPTGYFNDEENSPIVSFILRVIEFATKIIGSIAIILFIIAGFMMMVAQGNQQKLDEAKDIFLYAAIGLIVAFLSYVIVIFIQSLFVTTN